jgi:hypothetical protein
MKSAGHIGGTHSWSVWMPSCPDSCSQLVFARTLFLGHMARALTKWGSLTLLILCEDRYVWWGSEPCFIHFIGKNLSSFLIAAFGPCDIGTT